MRRKQIQQLVILAGILGILLLGLILAKPGYYLYREIAYRTGTPTEAERIVHTYSQVRGIPYGSYPVELIELLERNMETEEFVLQYPFRQETEPDLGSFSRETVPLFLQWDPLWGYEEYGSSYLAITGCGPTCLAMAGYYLTGDAGMTPDRVAAFSEENGYYARGSGSSWTLISEGAGKLGLQARELPLVKKKIVTALEEGSPVILALGAGDFTSEGHYIVLTAAEEDGFRVNDPNSRENSGKLWTWQQLEPQIRNIWAISLP